MTAVSGRHARKDWRTKQRLCSLRGRFIGKTTWTRLATRHFTPFNMWVYEQWKVLASCADEGSMKNGGALERQRSLFVVVAVGGIACACGMKVVGPSHLIPRVWCRLKFGLMILDTTAERTLAHKANKLATMAYSDELQEYYAQFDVLSRHGQVFNRDLSLLISADDNMEDERDAWFVAAKSGTLR
jgi:hypothetical protein